MPAADAPGDRGGTDMWSGSMEDDSGGIARGGGTGLTGAVVARSLEGSSFLS